MSSKRDKMEKQAALKIHSNQCAMCGNYMVEIHHIIYRSHSGKNVRQNLIPLCKKHHMLVHTNEKYYVEYLLDLNRIHYGIINRKDLIKRNKWER